MKKIILCLFIFCFIFSFSVTAFAETQPVVVDEASLLSEQEAVELTKRFEEMRDTYNVDVAFVSAEQLYNSEGIVESADDYFDYGGYGFGKNYDGIMFYISMDVRQYAFSTCGYAIDIFNDSVLDYMEDEIVPYLKDGDYYAAADVYASVCAELLKEAFGYSASYTDGDYYDNSYSDYDDEYYYGSIFENLYYESSMDSTEILTIYALFIGAAVIIALIKTKRKERQMKTAVRNNLANEYVRQGSMNVTVSQDVFLYSNVRSIPKPKDTDSGSSHSSTHTSSSGRTHGGSSGSF